MEEAICSIVMVIIMTENIEHKKFMPFILDDVFYIYSSNSGIDKNKLKTGAGDIPYITRTDRTNGIDSFVCEQDSNKYKKDSGNVITIGLDTQTVFYQQHDFYTGQNIQILSNPNLTFESSLYIIPLLKMVLEKFSWGSNGATLTRLKRSKIMLPANNKDEPDFNYMTNYIKEPLFKEINDIKEYCKSVILNINNKSIPKLTEKKWKAFNVNYIFPYIQRGKRLKKGDHKAGNIPYVSSTMMNNGVDNFISNKEGKRFDNCITIANSGSVGASFYHQYEFIGSDHITAFKNEKFNKYIYLFLATIVSRISDKYSFNREINDFRISNEKVLLPVNEDGNPDYEYMEQYIKNIMCNQYKRYLDFLED